MTQHFFQNIISGEYSLFQHTVLGVKQDLTFQIVSLFVALSCPLSPSWKLICFDVFVVFFPPPSCLLSPPCEFIQLRNKLNQEQNAKLQQQRECLNKRNSEVAVMDKRVNELRERLWKKKAALQQKENVPVSGGCFNHKKSAFICGTYGLK